MQDTSNLTLNKIQQAAIDEFLEKGFRGASLRQIVKHWSFLWIFFQQRSLICFNCRTACTGYNG